MSTRRVPAVFHRLSLLQPHPADTLRPRCALELAAYLLLLFGLIPSGIAQQTIHVPTDQPTIQAGINAAANGDTVLVAPGTYYENIDFKGKAITVTSSGGAAQTIIDGSFANPTVAFHSGETRDSILNGFTIQHGGIPNLFYGDAGIYISLSAPSILNNTVTHNQCRGIHIYEASPLIQSNNINNTEDAGQCAFAGGSALWIEGAFYSGPLIPTVIGNVIENNTQSGKEDAGGSGGAGIAVWAGSPLIENNVIRSNKTLGVGGGINVVSPSGAVIVQNLIYGNTAAGAGGLAFDFGTASSPGPVVGFVINNTIANNAISGQYGYTGDVLGSQVYIWEQSSQTAFVNNVISGTSTAPLVMCDPIWASYTYQDTIFDHNDFYNSAGPLFGGTCTDKTGSFGNISADPKFVSPSSFDFHLASGSPAIDAGNNSAAYIPAKDLDGNPRQLDSSGKLYPIVDIGTYEFAGVADANPTVLTLTPSAYLINAGVNLTLSSHAISVSGVPTGTIDFVQSGKRIGSVILDASGNAILPIAGLAPGFYSFVASYPGQGVFTPADSVVTFVIVNNYAPTLKVSATPNPVLAGQPATLTVTISSPDNLVLSPIMLTDNGTTLATLTPDSTGTATFITAYSTVSTHYIQASYAGDATHNAEFASVLVQVVAGTATSTTITSSSNPALHGQSVTFTATVQQTSGTGAPSGSVTFSDSGTVLATATLNATTANSATAAFSTTTLSAGGHNITATFNPAAGFAPSSATLPQNVIGENSSTIFTATPNPVYVNQATMFNATVNGLVGTPTGNVTFYDGTAALATVPLDSTGHAAFTTSTLAIGSHPLYASYAGDRIYASSKSITFTEIVVAPPADFSITLANPSITIRTQHHTTTTLTLASVSGFADTLAISCANLPQYLTCRPTPGSAVLVANGSTQVSLYLDTDSVLGYAHNSIGPLPGRLASIACAFLFAPLALFGCTRGRNRGKLGIGLVVLVLALLPLSLALAGCGEIILPAEIPPSVAPGTYIIPITATGAVSGISHSAQLTLQVTP